MTIGLSLDSFLKRSPGGDPFLFLPTSKQSFHRPKSVVLGVSLLLIPIVYFMKRVLLVVVVFSSLSLAGPLLAVDDVVIQELQMDDQL